MAYITWFSLAQDINPYPDEMPQNAAFHLGLHCLPFSTHLGANRIQKVNCSFRKPCLGSPVKKATYETPKYGQ